MTSAVKQKPAETFILPKQAGLTLPGEGQTWLDSLRNTAAQNFIKHGLPTVRDEECRYTDILRLKPLYQNMMLRAFSWSTVYFLLLRAKMSFQMVLALNHSP